MNSPITFPPAEPILKLNRPSAEKWAATLAEERRRLHEDQEALREREQNLRDYETRLRALQAEIEAGRTGAAPAPAPAPRTLGASPAFLRSSSQAPFQDDPSLQAAWEKLHRAREIFEAEQKNQRDDRIAMREQEAQIKRREEALAAREARLAEREALVLAATPPPQPAGESAVTRMTRAPFSIARSVFGKKE
jgi:hypothetical protein